MLTWKVSAGCCNAIERVICYDKRNQIGFFPFTPLSLIEVSVQVGMFGVSVTRKFALSINFSSVAAQESHGSDTGEFPKFCFVMDTLKLLPTAANLTFLILVQAWLLLPRRQAGLKPKLLGIPWRTHDNCLSTLRPPNAKRNPLLLQVPRQCQRRLCRSAVTDPAGAEHETDGGPAPTLSDRRANSEAERI
jgi:hypothetical protein